MRIVGVSLRAVALGSALTLASLVPALAFDPDSPAPVNVDQGGALIGGVDVVSLMTMQKPEAGSSDHVVEMDGAMFKFASADHAAAFKADPAKFTPAFGGFCATGAAFGKKIDIDPQFVRVYEGQTMLFSSAAALEAWDKDPAGMYAKAVENWAQIKDKTPASLN